MTRPDTLLLDVGGTFIKCSDGRTVPVDSAGSKESIVSSLREAALGGPGGVPRRLALAVPGPFNYREGIFLMKHKFAAVYGSDIRSLLELPQDTGIRCLHDVVAVLLGVMQYNPGNVALITIGTGLGFACSAGGKILLDSLGSPARSLYNKPYKDGILEDVISRRGVTNAYERLTGVAGVSPLDVSLKARAGEPEAIKVYSDLGSILGEEIAPILDELGIKALLFGGQISKSFNLFEAPLRERLSSVSGLRTIAMSPEGAVFRGLEASFSNNVF